MKDALAEDFLPVYKVTAASSNLGTLLDIHLTARPQWLLEPQPRSNIDVDQYKRWLSRELVAVL